MSEWVSRSVDCAKFYNSPTDETVQQGRLALRQCSQPGSWLIVQTGISNCKVSIGKFGSELQDSIVNLYASRCRVRFDQRGRDMTK